MKTQIQATLGKLRLDTRGTEDLWEILDNYRYDHQNVHDVVSVNDILPFIHFQSEAERCLAEKMILLGMALCSKAYCEDKLDT